MSATPVEILGDFPSARVASLGSVMVVAWRGHLTAAVLSEVNTVEAALIARYGRISVIGVVTELSTGVPDEDLRRASADAMKRFQSDVRGTALVIAATGVKAVLARTFFAGLSLMMTFESPLRGFRNVADAVAWQRTLPGQDAALLDESAVQSIDRFISSSVSS